MVSMKIRAIGVIIKNGEVLLMRRVRDGREYFVFPGGAVEKGETIEEAVVREIKEELSLDVKINKLLFEMENLDEKEYYYLITDFSGTPLVGGEEKERMSERNIYEPVWKKIKELPVMGNLYPEEAREKITYLV